METGTPPEPPRPPERADLLTLCRELNARGVQYVVVGGMAMIQQGYLRATEDIDLLLAASPQNIEKVRQALEILPDKAVRDLREDDLENYTVVRVADEIIVDLMLKTCGISFSEARGEIVWEDIDGVSIPFASLSLLLKTKQTGREKDALDRLFLERKAARQKGSE